MRLSRCCSTSKAICSWAWWWWGDSGNARVRLFTLPFFACRHRRCLGWLPSLKGLAFLVKEEYSVQICTYVVISFRQTRYGFRYGFLQSFFKTTQKVSVCLFVPTYVTMYLYIILLFDRNSILYGRQLLSSVSFLSLEGRISAKVICRGGSMLLFIPCCTLDGMNLAIM